MYFKFCIQNTLLKNHFANIILFYYHATPMNNIGLAHESLDMMVHRRLRDMIINKELEPGSKIYQEKLSKELGISRTPLMSALKKLEFEKLIETVPRRGFYVRALTKRELFQIYELREVLEGLAARRVATGIKPEQAKKLKQYFHGFETGQNPINIKAYAKEDQSFHNYLVELGGKEFLTSIWQSFNIMPLSQQLMFDSGLVRPPAETHQEHLLLIEAILDRRPEQAEELARNHIKVSRENLYLKHL